MLGLLKSTEISINFSKKTILENFEGTRKQKDIFNSEIQSVKVVNELSSHSLPVTEGNDIKEIFFVEVELKQADISDSTLDILFRLIPHKVVLILIYEGQIRLAAHETKTFKTDWLNLGYNIRVEGLSVDDIWKHLVEAIGGFIVYPDKSLKEQIEVNSKIEVLEKQIEKLQCEKDKSKTPTRKYDLNCHINILKGEIRDLKDEKA